VIGGEVSEYPTAVHEAREVHDTPSRKVKVPRGGFAAVWTGHYVLVWGGLSGRSNQPPAHGEAYNPVTNLWTALPGAPIGGRADPVAVWTGRQMIVWGGAKGTTAPTDGAAFTPR